MSLPLQEIPSQIKALLSYYKKNFTLPQYKNFRDFVFGLVVSDNKTIQEINDCYGRVNQSSLNRFFTESDWQPIKINNRRITQIKSRNRLKSGILICDPTFLEKYGKAMEKANYHYNGMSKKEDWGYLLVNSYFTDGKCDFPVCADFYLRKEDIDEKHPFKTVREICIEQLDYAVKKLPIWLFIADAGLYADFLIQNLRSRGLKYIIGTRITNNISIDGQKRISIESYMQTLTDDNFNYYFIDGEAYFVHVIDVSERGVGKEKLIISYKAGDEEEIRINVTNIMHNSDEELLYFLLKRWKIEVWHRDAKQHLGLEDCQARKFGALQKVVCAVLVAYTQLILMRIDKFLKPLNRVIATIGEGCRYLRLIALKGVRWLKKKAANIDEFKKILNEQVFVKNAKV
jgi:hypothetical protein